MNWKLAPCLRVYIDQINKEYPKRSKVSDGTIGDAAHQAVQSDHNPNAQGIVTAFDLTHDPRNGVDIQKEADRLVASKDPRIKYIIVNRKIWELGSWKPYVGKDPHTGHLHLSVKASNVEVVTPWRLNKEEDMTIKDAAEVNLLWQLNGLRSPTEKEVKEALGRELSEYLTYLLKTEPVKANIAKVKYYDKDVGSIKPDAEAWRKLVKDIKETV